MADAALPHPMRFPLEHPLTERVRAICLPYPEAAEVPAHGRSTFRAGKRQFAIVGAAHDDAGAVEFIPDDLERPVLLERDDVFVPPYEGAYGWLAIRVEPDAGDWELLAELIDTSYRQVALQRQLRALDGG
ncbi:putative DNA-binding protein (MmcQ/YjbR family) [Microbacterium trichothecenolyticum]|uniref:MmcQ/YjbR family DNA-binding protein n=1 Tax=Microbacterium trichothecenolyticum TaxID=69370 RepID=UPI00285F84BC|nr:MmcQ/YjbR family DNA-binding protein [Microbacterium trichothecenolyticum]MDR7183445.1 putative DNA-binding protein (MmcQ/YjbR family) [Microbacterium trichothecenolyticum]